MLRKSFCPRVVRRRVVQAGELKFNFVVKIAMPPFHHFTTKAKEAIRRAHELAIERGQNHVNPLHLLAALVLQEESIVISILEKLEVDTVLLTDSILEAVEGAEGGAVVSPSFQIYLTPELAQILENSSRVAATLKDEFVSTEHLFISMFDVPGSARDMLSRFKLDRPSVVRVLEELQGAYEVYAQPHLARARQQARPRYRPRQRDFPHHTDSLPPYEK